ncbi:MAG: Lrp/AsnC family transcriptional regulator [Maribacter sp.]|nr:Lrp/AsnC family transcriptional regulator [Maribacter sp.]
MKSAKLDNIDHQILEILIENARTSYTDIAKKLGISAGTVHLRIKKVEKAGLIGGTSLLLDYKKLGYGFVAFVGIYLEKADQVKFVLQRLEVIPNITVAQITTGKFDIFCKIRAKDINQARNIIFDIEDLDCVEQTEAMFFIEESINDKKRLIKTIFDEY